MSEDYATCLSVVICERNVISATFHCLRITVIGIVSLYLKWQPSCDTSRACFFLYRI